MKVFYKVNIIFYNFEEMKILHKEIRIVERIYEGEKIKQGFVDYIVKKI